MTASLTPPLQLQVSQNGIEKPFIAFPPGSESGNLAKTESTVITDEEMKKLQDAKMLLGGVEVQWKRMTGVLTLISTQEDS